MRTAMMINITESRDDSDNNTSEVVREFINRGMVFTRADLLLWMHTQWGNLILPPILMIPILIRLEGAGGWGGGDENSIRCMPKSKSQTSLPCHTRHAMIQ